MKYDLLFYMIASLLFVSCKAVNVAFINNTGHRVTVEPVRRYIPPGASPLEQGRIVIGGSTLIPAGDQDIATRSHTYQDVDFSTLDSYNVYYPAGYIRAYLPATKIAGREIAQRAAQVNASRVEIILTAGYTGIGYTINALERPQTGTTQPITFEESFIGIGMEDPLETLLLYKTLDKNPDDPAHIVLGLTMPPQERAQPGIPLAQQSLTVKNYTAALQSRYEELVKQYTKNREKIDYQYLNEFGIADYTDKILALYHTAYKQLIDQIGL